MLSLCIMLSNVCMEKLKMEMRVLTVSYGKEGQNKYLSAPKQLNYESMMPSYSSMMVTEVVSKFLES